jgi:hypothetical protein
MSALLNPLPMPLAGSAIPDGPKDLTSTTKGELREESFDRPPVPASVHLCRQHDGSPELWVVPVFSVGKLPGVLRELLRRSRNGSLQP